MNVAYNCDCMEYMKKLPDKYFDLAVVDPPYGGGAKDDVKKAFKAKDGRFGGNFEKYAVNRTGGNWGGKYGNEIAQWDIAPSEDYFQELFRVSKNQIIWGGNYFSLPPARCFIVWRKTNISENFSMAMAEYAWTSFNENAKVFGCSSVGKRGERFHPTQKPIKLYKWIFSRYAKQGDKILDTHLGSGSSRIAAYDAGLDFVGCELDEEYFRKEEERFAAYTAQQSLFGNEK